MIDRESMSHRHSHLIIILISVLIGVVLTTVACNLPAGRQGTTAAMAQNLGALEEGFTQVADRTLPAVVSIVVQETGVAGRAQAEEDMEELFRRWFFGPEGSGRDKSTRPYTPQREYMREGMGSGWVYSEDGYIVTNAHVVAGATKVTVTLHDQKGEEQEVPAVVVGQDPKTELAVIKVDAGRKLPTLKLGSSDQARVGSWVVAVGAPYRFEQTVTVGVISAKGRILLPDPVDRPFFRLDDLIQTDAAINPGNSGGPMVNLNGEVVGISVAYFTPSAYGGNAGIGFGIPADSARQVIPQLIEHKRVARGWLGVQIKDLSTNLRQYYGAPDGGALVVTIEQDSPAADSDLQPEDVIVAVNDTPTPDGWTLSKTVANTAPGEKVTLKVVRDKQERQIEVTLRDMPARYAGLEETPAETAPAPAGALGLTVVDITASMAAQSHLSRESGAVVKQVAPDSPAYGKLSPGDVILKLNGQEVKSVADYQQAIERAKKDKAEFVVFHVERRAGEEVLADVVDVPTNW